MTLSKSRLTFSFPVVLLVGAVLALYFAFTLPVISYWASRVAWKGGFSHQAEVLLLRSLEKQPTQERFAFLVKLSLSMGNYRKADWAVRQWVQTFPSAVKKNPRAMANLYIEMGKEALRKYDWKSVQEFYKQALVYGATKQLFREIGEAAKASAIEAIKEAKFERFFELAKLAHRFGEEDDQIYRDTARQAFYNFLKLRKMREGEDILDLLRWLHEEEDVVQSLQWDLGFEMGKLGFQKGKKQWKKKGWELLLHSSPPDRFRGKSLFLSFPLPFWKSKSDYLLPQTDMLLEGKEHIVALHPLAGKRVLLMGERKVWLLDRMAGVMNTIYSSVQDMLEDDRNLYLIVSVLSPKGMEKSRVRYQLLQYNFHTGAEKRIAKVEGKGMYWCALRKICVEGEKQVEIIALPQGIRKVVYGRSSLFYLDGAPFSLKQSAKETIAVSLTGKVLFRRKGRLSCRLYSPSFLLCRVGEQIFLLSLQKTYELSKRGEMAFASGSSSAIHCCKSSSFLIDGFQQEKKPTFISLPAAPMLSLPSPHLYLESGGTHVYVRTLKLLLSEDNTALHAIWVEKGGKQFVLLPTFLPVSLLRLSHDGRSLFFVLKEGTREYLMSADIEKQRPFTLPKPAALPQSEQKLYWLFSSLSTIEAPQKGELDVYLKAVQLLYGKRG